VNIISDLRKI